MLRLSKRSKLEWLIVHGLAKTNAAVLLQVVALGFHRSVVALLIGFHWSFRDRATTMFRPYCFAAFLLACLLSTGCSSGEKKVIPYTGKPLKLAFIPGGSSDNFWSSVELGTDKATNELGNVEIVWSSPAVENDDASQADIVDAIISQAVDGIILAPNQKRGIVAAVQKAIDAGIPVVIAGNELESGPAIVGRVATDNFLCGKLAAEEMAQSIGEQGNVILLRGIVGDESMLQRENGFLKGMKAYSKIKVVSADQRGGETESETEKKAGDLLLLFGGNLSGLFAVNATHANGALKALRTAGLEGQIKFMAVGTSEPLVAALEDGTCHGLILQDPVDLGFQSVLMMVDHIRGAPTERVVSTGAMVVTKENMNDKKIEKLLNTGS